MVLCLVAFGSKLVGMCCSCSLWVAGCVVLSVLRQLGGLLGVWFCAVEECMCMRPDASEWVQCEEEYLVVQQGLELLWVIHFLGV
jgi:hypothetical protein